MHELSHLMMRRTVWVSAGTMVVGLAIPNIASADPPFDFSKVRRPFNIDGDWRTNNFSIDVPPRGSFTLSGRFMDHSLTQAYMPVVQRRVTVRKRLRIVQGGDESGPVMLMHIDRGPNDNEGGPGARLFMMRPPAPFESFTNWAQIRSAIARRMRQIGQPIPA